VLRKRRSRSDLLEPRFWITSGLPTNRQVTSPTSIGNWHEASHIGVAIQFPHAASRSRISISPGGYDVTGLFQLN
jgi:hypothetical protein